MNRKKTYNVVVDKNVDSDEDSSDSEESFDEEIWSENSVDADDTVVRDVTDDGISTDSNETSSSRSRTSSSRYRITVSHERHAEKALKTLKDVIKEDGWTKELSHKSGVNVYSKNKNNTPIYMGTHDIDGFDTQDVFAVIGMRKLWDEWYEEGNLVENLNDTTSLTYMVLQALSGSKPRDLSLVEKIECGRDGTIYFVATSVRTDKVPKVVNRIRAKIILNGWVLEPISTNPPKTRVTYILQTQIKGWIPAFVANKYLSKRPLILHAIDKYLQKNGSPSSLVDLTPPISRSPSFSINKSSSKSLSLSTTGSEPLAVLNNSENIADKVNSSDLISNDGDFSFSKVQNVTTEHHRFSQKSVSFPENDFSIKMNLINESAAFKSINTTKLDHIKGIGENYNITSSIINNSSKTFTITYDDDQKQSEESKQLENTNNNNTNYSKINSRNSSQTNHKSLPHQDQLKLPLPKLLTNIDVNIGDNPLKYKESHTLPKGSIPLIQDSDEKEKDRYDDSQKENIKDKEEIIAEDLHEVKGKVSSSSSSHQKHEKKLQPSLAPSLSSLDAKKDSSVSRKKHHSKSSSQLMDDPSSSSSSSSIQYPTILKDKKPHRHTNALKESLDKFKSESSNLEGWKFYSENKGFKIYMKDVANKSTPMIRGEMAITGGFTTEDLFSIVYNLDMKNLWDDRYDGGEIIEFLNDYDSLVRVVTKGTFPISGRDMSLAGILDREEETGILRYVTSSVIDPLIPQSKKHVRADLHFAGWEFIPTYFDFDPKKIKSVFLKYIVDIDIKLATVPASILKQFTIQTPTVVLKINELLHKIGYPPYMLLESSSSRASLPDKLDIKTFDYTTTIKAFPGAIAEIKFSKLMYPNGFDLSFESHNDDDVKVELTAHDSEIIRITITSLFSPFSSLPSNMLKIKIKKNVNTKGYKLTYNNGEGIISVAPKEKIAKKNEESFDKKIVKINDNYDDKIKGKNIISIDNDSKILTKDKDNNKVEDEVRELLLKENNDDDIINKNLDDLDKDKTLVSRNIDIDIINTINDDSDNKDNKLRKNRRSVTSISRISISEQSFIKQKINDSSTTEFERRVISVNNVRTTSNLAKYMSVPAISKSTDNETITSQFEKKSLFNFNESNTNAMISTNTNNNTVSTINTNAITTIDSMNNLKTSAHTDDKTITRIIIEFNTQQLVMMILSMAMSFYAGKLSSSC